MNAIFYRYGSVYEPDMLAAFKQAGLNVVEINREIDDKSVTDRERIDLIKAAIEEYEPVFVYGVNYYPAISEVCRIYDVIYISQTVDSPIFTLFDKSIQNHTNRILLFDKAQYDLFSGFNPEGIIHLPLASAVDRFDKVISSITSDDRKRFASDIAFVGSTYREKDPYLNLSGLTDFTKGYVEAIIKASLKIYGYYPVKDALDEKVISDIKKAAGSDFPYIDGAVTDMDAYAVSHRYIGSHLAVVERERTLEALSEYFNVNLYTRSDTSGFSHIRSEHTFSDNTSNRFYRTDTDSANITSPARNMSEKINATKSNTKESANIGLYVHPGVNTLTEMPKVFNLSKINLNMTMRPIETGLPLRCFDILGCGGFLMTNYQEEINDMFVIGQDLEAYSSLEELIDKCAYYLTHEDERAAIARNGYEKVKAAHTHIHRLQKMLRTVIS